MSRSLAGTNGIPVEGERTYLRVVCEIDETGGCRPLEVIWADGRRFKVGSATLLRSYGRWNLGNYVAAYEITIKRHSRSNARRVIWWERGRWFTRKTERGARGMNRRQIR